MIARSVRPAVWLLCVVACATAGCSLVRRVGNHKPMLRQVNPPVAFEMLRDSPTLFVLDLRSAEEFKGPKGHIHGAKNIPLDQLSQRLNELSAYRDQTLLVYCDTSDCGLEGMHVLNSSGFDSAILIVGGIDGWIADGYGTVGKGPKDGSPPKNPGARNEADLHNFLEVLPRNDA